ncbi:MAG: hypothetical protein GY930_10900 [bacterium]|nr:hypothetical protein [bacterium]
MSTDPNNSPESAENEDLFDFPLVGAYASQDLDAPSAPEQTPPEAARVEETAAGVPAHEAAAPMPTAKAAPAPKKAAPPKDLTGQADPALDEDLFDFETRFKSSQPLTTEEDAIDLGAMLEQHVATEGVLVQPTPESAPEVSAPSAAPAASASAPAPAAANPAPAAKAASPTKQAVSPAPISVSSDVPAAMWTPPPAAPAPEGKRGHLIEILALCFLVLSTALVILAWRASDDFRETLANVNNTVIDAVSEGHSRGQLQNATDTQGSMDVTPDVTSANVEPEIPTVDQPSEFVRLPRVALDLAIERIAEGKFEMARKGLYFLLANQDRTVLNEELIVEAEALVAKTYADQAKELRQ